MSVHDTAEGEASSGLLQQSLTRPTDTTCDVCQHLHFEHDEGKLQRFTFDSAYRSAQNGCAGCAVIARFLKDFRGHGDGMDGLTKNWNLCKKGESTYLRVFVHVAALAYRRAEYLELSTTSDGTCPWPQLRYVAPVSMDTASDKAFSALRGWMQECSGSHKHCQRSLQASCLPTRVIEILDTRVVRLRETRNEKGFYTCLSHCWGAQPIIRTMTASIASHRISIPWADLPKTFQDAIDITRRLGIKYIWIDSLCILQDDSNDWRLEGSRMCDIYSNSHLTIAASKSEDSTGGCYATADAKDVTTHRFMGANQISYRVHGRRRIWHIDDEYFWGCELQHVSPLTKRAWILQERLLSPRVVYFGPVEISWECKEGSGCECSDWGHKYNRDRSEGLLRRHIFTGRMLDSHKVWQRVVRAYSGKSLSYEADIFPALQGIAKSLHRQGDYYAGLWDTSNLILDLLWCTWVGTSLKAWRAPTWSWASVKGEVYFLDEYGDSLENLASVVSIETVPLDSNQFGQLISGRLRLIGRRINARISSDIQSSAAPKGWRLSASSLCAASIDYLAITAGKGEEVQEGDEGFFWFIPDRKDEIFNDKSVVVMEIALGRSEKNLDTLCLVLSCVDAEKDVYARIGRVTLTNDMGTFERYGDGMPRLLTII